MKPITPRIEAVKDFRVTLILIVLVYIAGLNTVVGAANRREETDFMRRLKVLEEAREDQRIRNRLQDKINQELVNRLK